MSNEIRALTFKEIQDLKEFSKIATQGKWVTDGCDVRQENIDTVWDVKYICGCNFTLNMPYEERENNAKFIAKFNPYTIQCLIKSFEDLYTAYQQEL